MTDTQRLAEWHSTFPGMLAGSVYAAAPADRTSVARALAHAGQDIHVDVMSEADGLPAGVSIAELRDITTQVEPTRVGVHLIGSPEFVDSVLPDVLAQGPATVFLPWDSFDEARATSVRQAGSAAWIALWDEWNGFGTPQWAAEPDGVLVMLIKPGTRDNAALRRLGLVADCATRMPVAVDGGVTEDIAALCVTAGVRFMVVGRALLTSNERTR